MFGLFFFFRLPRLGNRKFNTGLPREAMVEFPVSGKPRRDQRDRDGLVCESVKIYAILPSMSYFIEAACKPGAKHGSLIGNIW